MDEMTRAEIETLFGRVNDENARQNKRLDRLEEQGEKLTELIASVREIALSIKGMQEEQAKQGERLEKIEQEPADNWRSVVKTVTTVLVTAAITYLLSGGIH
ncbi:MAG: hypothetical protein IKF99_03195 [Oscillospiraceae bacterium]|nr:hypothetical protein [Oscillospiraceae bacterium]